jgi:glycosyltransferase involved in cell wall biosynthesis
MISVISCTNHPERLKLNEKCLEKQTYKDFEFIVDTTTEKPEGFVYALNRAMNSAIKKSKGELLVRIDDGIWFPPDTLEKFAFHFKNNPQACVSGVGDQYDQLDDNGKPCHVVWLDPRKRADMGSLYISNPDDWEGNLCSFGRHLIYEIGGWDEEMDRYYAWDNVAVALRLKQVGAEFFLDQTLESFSISQTHNKDWNENGWDKHDFLNWLSKRPPKLEFLP